MMKQSKINVHLYSIIICCSLVCSTKLFSNTYTIGTGGDYATILDAVNAASTGDTLLLVSGQTFTGAGNSGIEIAKNLTFGTTGATKAIVDLSGTATNLFLIDATYTVTINNLVIQNGLVNSYGYQGGAIFNNGILNTYTCTFSNNQATNGWAGAIYNNSNATYTANQCTFNSNLSLYNGGAIYCNIFGTLALSNCTFNNNNCTFGSGGAINDVGNAPAGITRCTFTGNLSGQKGGAIFLESGRSLVVSYCTFSSNSITAHDSNPDYGGGALYNNGGTLTVSNCSIQNNDAGTYTHRGGALYNYSGTTAMNGNCIENNSADTGSAVAVQYGSVTAAYNWWGSSSPAPTLFYGNVSYSPWSYRCSLLNGCYIK